MWNRFISAVKWRAFFVVILIHLGFAGAIAILFQLTMDAQVPRHQIYGLLASLGTIYLALLIGLFFVAQPFLPWIRRVRMVMEWRRLLLEQWPVLIKMLPEIIETVQAIVSSARDAWENVTEGAVDETEEAPRKTRRPPARRQAPRASSSPPDGET